VFCQGQGVGAKAHADAPPPRVSLICNDALAAHRFPQGLGGGDVTQVRVKRSPIASMGLGAEQIFRSKVDGRARDTKHSQLISFFAFELAIVQFSNTRL
jgi:hypothetical protein